MSLYIRPARKEDVISAAYLIAETNGEFGVQVLGLGNPDLQLIALQKWFSDEGNRFSYQHSLIAEKYGFAAGLLVGFSGSQLSKLELSCARQIIPIYGFFGALKMIWRNKSLANYKEAQK